MGLHNRHTLDQYRLSPSARRSLAVVEGAGQPLEPSVIAERLVVTTGSMTSLLDNLEKRGLVRRLPHPEDRRKLLVDITPEARAIVDELLPTLHARERDVIGAALTASEQRTLLRLLAKLQRVAADRSIHANTTAERGPASRNRSEARSAQPEGNACHDRHRSRDTRAPRPRPRGVGSTTSRSSPPTWTRPFASTTAFSAPGSPPPWGHLSFVTTSSSSALSALSRSSSTPTRPSSPSPNRPACPTPAHHSSTTWHSTFPTRTRSMRCGNGSRTPAARSPKSSITASVRSVYFTDPNGIALEASWWVRDVTGRPDDYDDDQRFGDPNPVPALHELRTTGTLTNLLSTQLL